MKDLSRKIISVLTGIIIFIIITQILVLFPILAHAETEIAFTPGIKFEIPSNNSSISFASNGTYEMAILENRTWSFNNLHFINSQSQEKLDLKVSANDCDVTINLYRIYNRTFGGGTVKRATLSYSVIGHGTQIFNLMLDPKNGELDARLNGEWVGKNHGWTHSSDGTFTITGATENVALLYYGYPDSYGDSENFFDDHSVVIASTFSVGIVLFLTAFITKRKELK